MYKLLLTREEEKNLESKKIFSSYNINTISLPMIETIPKEFELKDFDFDCIIFSSRKAVEIFFKNLHICKNAKINVYIVGEKTKEYFLGFYNTKNLIARDSIKEILPIVNCKTLWIRTDFELPEDIKNMVKNKDIFILEAYKTKHKIYELRKVLETLKAVNGVFFASPSAFLGLLKNLQNYKYILNEKDIFAIGNTTADAIKNEGFQVTYVPQKPSVESIAKYISSIGT
ncbi:Uroporphyrinogen III synthase HEM4 [Hydrogenobaculum sp. Y04AAS1]|uniref:uroporphyrinogen-III synthase n=1 Tax=Hydrogenobaculum sp. (strain Y04AAS1) TaxID=380749 RepID=UPI00017BBDF7|nr:Uroporphyrinogen III synthase HEM4 [Hydrogenobaculum sp. Y04AAS1]HCT65870.1 uroporphyrinogen-III synthase [Hydrogenobaculum sp.]